MSKERSQFAALSEQDRKYILELCDKHHYDDVVELLKQERSAGGLDIATSSSALCRFYTSRLDPAGAVFAQKAAATNIRHEQDSNAFFGAILASVQARVLENLQRGKALTDMDKEFKHLKTAQSLYLAEANFRAKHPKAARAAYQAHVDRCAQAPDFDFMTIRDLANHPEELGTFCEAHMSQFERDVLQSRERQERNAEARDPILATLERAGVGPQADSEESFSSEAPGSAGVPAGFTTVTPGDHEDVPAQSHLEPSKSPVIPPIPLNSTSPNHSTSDHPDDAPGSEPEKTPLVPFVRPAPRTGRNDPCPCGSGRKYKRCCLKSANSHALAA